MRSAAQKPASADELDDLRARIEAIDQALVDLIADRIRLADRVRAAKEASGRATLDPAREAAVVRRAVDLARQAGVDDEGVRHIFWHLIGMTRRAQQE
jgi:chorismate mutase